MNICTKTYLEGKKNRSIFKIETKARSLLLFLKV